MSEESRAACRSEGGDRRRRQRDTRERRRGPVVFVNGCFDQLHAGHVQLLKWARVQGGRLVVGLNSDDSVARLKGPGRPVNPMAARREVLEELRCVDSVVVFYHDTPRVLVENLRPDVYVSGAEYSAEELAANIGETVTREGHEIRVERFPMVPR